MTLGPFLKVFSRPTSFSIDFNVFSNSIGLREVSI